MRINDFLHLADVRGELTGSSPHEVLAELVRPVAASECLDSRVLLEQLLAREALGSTGVGEGVALPHGKVAGLTSLRASLGRSRGGVDFATADGRPAHLFVALFSPAARSGVHLHALALVSRLLREPSVRQSLLAAGDEVEMYESLLAADARLAS